jgi:hypothetical protein
MKSNQFRVVKFYCKDFHSDIYLPWLFVYLPWLTLTSPRCDIIDWHYDRGLNNSKLTVWSLITLEDGGMRVWHFNGVITKYGKRDCRNSWRYARLAVNRGAIKRGFIFSINLVSQVTLRYSGTYILYGCHLLRCLYTILYFLWLYNAFFSILYNILKIADLDCCQIIILSIYVPSTHA